MQRYLLFAGINHYPQGGIKDFKGSFPDPNLAIMAALVHACNGADWAHVVDRQSANRALNLCLNQDHDGNPCVLSVANDPGLPEEIQLAYDTLFPNPSPTFEVRFTWMGIPIRFGSLHAQLLDYVQPLAIRSEDAERLPEWAHLQDFRIEAQIV